MLCLSWIVELTADSEIFDWLTDIEQLVEEKEKEPTATTKYNNVDKSSAKVDDSGYYEPENNNKMEDTGYYDQSEKKDADADYYHWEETTCHNIVYWFIWPYVHMKHKCSSYQLLDHWNGTNLVSK